MFSKGNPEGPSRGQQKEFDVTEEVSTSTEVESIFESGIEAGPENAMKRLIQEGRTDELILNLGEIAQNIPENSIDSNVALKLIIEGGDYLGDEIVANLDIFDISEEELFNKIKSEGEDAMTENALVLDKLMQQNDELILSGETVESLLEEKIGASAFGSSQIASTVLKNQDQIKNFSLSDFIEEYADEFNPTWGGNWSIIDTIAKNANEVEGMETTEVIDLLRKDYEGTEHDHKLSAAVANHIMHLDDINQDRIIQDMIRNDEVEAEWFVINHAYVSNLEPETAKLIWENLGQSEATKRAFSEMALSDNSLIIDNNEIELTFREELESFL